MDRNEISTISAVSSYNKPVLGILIKQLAVAGKEHNKNIQHNNSCPENKINKQWQTTQFAVSSKLSSCSFKYSKVKAKVVPSK